ncbi:MAG TPA: radical SAM family heme chaperone HemW [Vicinamibacterales bacterium]|nr:radical SAM family heme chaperone HemW [Vicinamibacterales bacterium]
MALGLYLHIPFCQAICTYCNFNRGLLDPALKTRYVTALEQEIRAAATRGAAQPADTIFFGGGTPSLLEPAEVARLIGACRDTFDVARDAEVTLETNPETATPERLAAFRAAGVNRISFGVQSFDEGELARLGRIHSSQRARDAMRDARAAGFANLSFDLMFWLPGQTLETWRRTLAEAIALAPDHLSIYLLELYPNAPIKEAMARAAGPARADWIQAADDVAADMYLEALDRLDEAGLAQYEISNVARPGYGSRHNVKYWQEGAWIGFGCGAHSTVHGERWKNLASTTEYVDRISRGASVRTDAEHLTPASRAAEALFTGLRLTAGVDRGNFLARHGVDPWLRYEATLGPYAEEGLMWVTPARFGLTRRGMLVANEILVTFV